MKYMICGIAESEIALIGNNKSKLLQNAMEIAKSNYEAYIQNCNYLQEKSELTFKDFKFFEVEEYNENFINTYLKKFDIIKVE